MRTHGITVDTKEIARKFFKMIPKKDRVCMVVGMLPKEWMDRLEESMRITLSLKQYPDMQDEELAIFKRNIKPEVLNPIMQQLAADLLGEATKAGICKV